ncbi:hypothetical protein BGZ93_008698 [Podila epicladia]|nr:hypothetical protein BGZ92_008234 [Podila epicladia]KAG0099214.1 hypothetical protein BGZ93_008698 [Podila epicladia]
MHPTHSTFVPELDMNPPTSWSKPANALGLSNPLSHLPQSQQVRRLQQQIQQHKQLQQQSNSPFGSGQSRKRSMSSKPESRHLYQSQQGSGFGSGHQHINIKNSDHNSDDDVDEDEDDEDDENENENDRANQEGTSGLHHRSASHPQLTHGFSIPGFSGFGPSSPMSPSSPGSIASESSSITASMLSPGLISPGGGHHHFPHHHGNNSGIESSLASLASLSVMPTTPTSSSGSSASVPMMMPGRNNRFGSGSGGPYNSNSNTPTTGSFQPQSVPGIYQNQVASSGQNTPSFTAFSSALSQHLQRQQQQQMASTMATMSSSLPAHSGFHQLQQQFQQQIQQQHMPQQQQQQHQSSSSSQKTRSRSKSLTIPAPRIIPPTRVIPPRAPQTSAPRKYHGRQTRKLPSAPVVKDDIDPTRRVAHIISEQKRREKINGGFDELKSVIPECAQNTDSKATILRKAVDYILLLEDELRKYADAYQEAEGIEHDEENEVQSP